MHATMKCENIDCGVLLRLPNARITRMQCPRCGHVHSEEYVSSALPTEAKGPSVSAEPPPKEGILTKPLKWLSSMWVTRTVPRGAHREVPELACPWCEEEAYPHLDLCPTCEADHSEERLAKIVRRTLGLRSFFGWAAIMLIVHGVFGMFFNGIFVLCLWAAAIPLCGCLELPTYPLPDSMTHYASLARVRERELVFDLYKAKTDRLAVANPDAETFAYLSIGVLLLEAVWLLTLIVTCSGIQFLS